MPQPLLNGGPQEYVEDEPTMTDEIMRLSDRISELESKIGQVKREAVIAVLQMFSDSLRHIASGSMEIPDAAVITPVSDNRMASAWQKWIDKFGADSFKGKFISALLTHNSLNARQLLIHLGTSRMQTVYDTAFALTKLSLVRKNGENVHADRMKGRNGNQEEANHERTASGQESSR